MRSILFAITCIFPTPIFPQDIYQHKTYEKVISLGSIDINNNKTKSYINKESKILYLNTSELEKIDELSSKDYLEQISLYSLYFKGGGDEPFWDIALNDKEAFLTYGDSDDVKHFNIKAYFNNNQHAMRFTFSSKDKDIVFFGLVRRSDNDKCQFSLSEENQIYEITLTTERGIYLGCASVGER